MSELNDYIPSPETMKAQTIKRAMNRKKIELKSAVIKVSDIIRGLSAGGLGFIHSGNSEVVVVLKECSFITWSMIVKVFKDAGYSIGEGDSIVWATADEIRKSE